MARRVRCLAAFDHHATRAVVVAYSVGWSGLVPEAAFAAAPAGVFEEIVTHADPEPSPDVEDPGGDPEGGA